MQITTSLLLEQLPAYRDEWLIINENQSVKDIISEVINAHELFADDYNRIALYFDADTTKQICDKVYSFIKRNLQYQEEPEESQTTSVPQGLLTRGHCDCKGYAGFAAGIIDSIRRQTGKRINWNYRFASYHMADTSPHHVFVVVNDNGKEIWIDPTPGATEKTPYWITDKKIKMPLLRNIAGINDSEPVGDFEITEDIYQDNTVSADLIQRIQLLLQYGVVDVNGNIYDAVLNNYSTSLPANEFQKLADARFSLEQQMISGFFDGIWRAIKVASLLVPRNAYLSMVALNVFGLGTKIKQAISTADGRKKVGDKWYSLGGNQDNLFRAAESGATKPKILGNTIGLAPAIPAWVATATAIIAAMTPLLKSILNQQAQQQVPYIPGYNPSDLISNYGTGGGNILDWVKAHPVESAGIAIAAYLLYKKFLTNNKAA